MFRAHNLHIWAVGRATIHYFLHFPRVIFTAHFQYSCALNTTNTSKLTTRGRVLLEKLIVPPLLEEFSAIYRTGRFITVFTTARHWSLSWVRRIHSTTYHHISSKSILVYQNSAQWDTVLCTTQKIKWPQNFIFNQRHESSSDRRRLIQNMRYCASSWRTAW